MDLRGRGESTPIISGGESHGQWESINEDIPKVLEFLEARHPEEKVHVVAHSWGGVMFNSFLVRHPEQCRRVSTLQYFGTKRSVGVWNLGALFKVRIMWERVGIWIARIYGYLPAKEWNFGADNETLVALNEGASWTRKSSRWIDPRDGFDYGEAAENVALPPGLYWTGSADLHLGHPKDVARFREESQHTDSEIKLLSKSNGYQHDYGHIDMLTHKDAPSDHFAEMLEWMKSKGKEVNT